MRREDETKGERLPPNLGCLFIDRDPGRPGSPLFLCWFFVNCFSLWRQWNPSCVVFCLHACGYSGAAVEITVVVCLLSASSRIVLLLRLEWIRDQVEDCGFDVDEGFSFYGGLVWWQSLGGGVGSELRLWKSATVPGLRCACTTTLKFFWSCFLLRCAIMECRWGVAVQHSVLVNVEFEVSVDCGDIAIYAVALGTARLMCSFALWFWMLIMNKLRSRKRGWQQILRGAGQRAIQSANLEALSPLCRSWRAAAIIIHRAP